MQTYKCPFVLMIHVNGKNYFLKSIQNKDGGGSWHVWTDEIDLAVAFTYIDNARKLYNYLIAMESGPGYLGSSNIFNIDKYSNAGLRIIDSNDYGKPKALTSQSQRDDVLAFLRSKQACTSGVRKVEQCYPQATLQELWQQWVEYGDMLWLLQAIHGMEKVLEFITKRNLTTPDVTLPVILRYLVPDPTKLPQD